MERRDEMEAHSNVECRVEFMQVMEGKGREGQDTGAEAEAVEDIATQRSLKRDLW
jgi:hypothetical protein